MYAGYHNYDTKCTIQYVFCMYLSPGIIVAFVLLFRANVFCCSLQCKLLAEYWKVYMLCVMQLHSVTELSLFCLQKLDPAQFLRVYGRPAKIHWEHSVAIAAESPQSM